ncbi:hypothetical protein ABPG72_012751 [Tetrahymena utriculariae]
MTTQEELNLQEIQRTVKKVNEFTSNIKIELDAKQISRDLYAIENHFKQIPKEWKTIQRFIFEQIDNIKFNKDETQLIIKQYQSKIQKSFKDLIEEITSTRPQLSQALIKDHYEMKNSERKLKGHHNSKFMDFQQAQQFEYQLSKKKQTKGRRKYKRNLKKAIEVSHQQQTQLADGYYEVESIQKIRSFGKYDLRFYIKWKGWEENDNTWEPFQNVRNCYFNLKEFYDKYNDNKKMTGSDAWKTFVGCLRRENLLDDKGKFIENIKRKYNKKKVFIKDIGDSEARSGSSENKSSESKEEEASYESIPNEKQPARLKLEEDQDENDHNNKSHDKNYYREREGIRLRKKISKRKNKNIQNGQQHSDGNNDEDDKADKTIEKKKRKQFRKRKSQNGQLKDESSLSTKAKKLKRTYSSTQSKKLNRNENINHLQQKQQIQIQQQDIDIKLEDEENRENIFQEFGTKSQNKQNVVPSKEQKDNSLVKNKTHLSEEASKRDTSKEGQEKYIASNSQLIEKEVNSRSNLSDGQKQLKTQSSSDEEEDDDDEEQEEEEEDQEDQEEGQDEEDKEEDENDDDNNNVAQKENQLEKSINHKRDFAQLQKDQNLLEGSELESKLLKKRKKEVNELTSTHILLEQKEVITSLQELEHLQQQDRQFNSSRYMNVENNLFGSNNNIDPELLHNENTQGKKFSRIINREYQIEDGSISEGNGTLKNHMISSFDNFNNRDQINSEQFLDKQSPTGLSNIHFSDQQRNLQLRNSISHQSYFNKKIFWTNTVIPQDMISSVQEQQPNISGSAIQRIIQDQNQAFEDSQYNNLLQQTYIQSFPLMEIQQNIYPTKSDLNKQKLLIGNSPFITIEDDDEEEIVENTELQYKLHNERDDKDKFTKIRLVKKHDSVEIQDAQPYKHQNQYLDELQQKRIRGSNYNDIQGQLGGLSKSLHELSQHSQPQIKNQYQKYKKEIQQIQQNNKNGIQKQNSNPNINSNGSQSNIPQFNDQTYEQFIISQFQEIKHLKNPEVKDPQKSIKSLYEGNLYLKDEPNRIIAMDIHPYLIGQYIFKVTWAPRKKKEQLISSWVEGDKLKLKYPNLVIEFYESFIRFVD